MPGQLLPPPSPVLDDDTLGIDGDAFDASDEGPEIVGPSTIEEEELLQALYRDMERGEQAKAVLAEAEMARVIALNQQLEHRAVDGMGQLVARIPLDMYLAWVAREGHEFWHQKDTIDYFDRRVNGIGNPGFKIKTRMKPTIVVDRKLAPGAKPGDAENSAAGAAIAPAATGRAPRRRGGRWSN